MPLGAQLLAYSSNVTQRHARIATQPCASPVSPSTLPSLTKVSIVDQSASVADLTSGVGPLRSSVSVHRHVPRR